MNPRTRNDLLGILAHAGVGPELLACERHRDRGAAFVCRSCRVLSCAECSAAGCPRCTARGARAVLRRALRLPVLATLGVVLLAVGGVVFRAEPMAGPLAWLEKANRLSEAAHELGSARRARHAQEALDRFARERPEFTTGARYARAALEAEWGDPATAITALGELVESPAGTPARVQLSRRLGDRPEEVLRLLEPMMGEPRGTPNLADRTPRTSVEEDLFLRARNLLLRGWTHEDQFREAWYLAALAHRKLGNEERARALLERVLRGSQDDLARRAREALAPRDAPPLEIRVERPED